METIISKWYVLYVTKFETEHTSVNALSKGDKKYNTFAAKFGDSHHFFVKC